MKLLAIETSCDETGLAILEVTGDISSPIFSMLGSELSSQADMHAQYGGVYPMMAKREHVANFPLLLKNLFADFGMTSGDFKIPTEQKEIILDLLSREPELADPLMIYLESHERPDIDAITVTVGPGLEPALWVGINAAKVLAMVWNLPLVPVNHMEGHILSVLFQGNHESGIQPLAQIEFPAIALLVSGGHTELVHVRDWMNYELIGQTRDDAAGEAFDKVARLLGLPYPGGPEISKLAATHIPSENPIELPRPMLHSGDYDFSFSGLKTAVRYLVRDLGENISPEVKAEIAHEFETSVVDVLTYKTKQALEEFGAQTLIVGGGVAANRALRARFAATLSKIIPTESILFPRASLTTDNAIMIGIAGYFRYKKNPNSFQGNLEMIRAVGNLEL